MITGDGRDSSTSEPVPRRILFVDHSSIVGGAQLALLEHIRALDRRKFHAIVACTDTAPALLDLYRQAGAEIHHIPMPRLRRLHPLVLPRLLRSACSLRRLVRSLGVDLVVTSTSRAAYIGALSLVRSWVPLVWWVHDFQFNRFLFRLAAPLAARIVCVSEAVRAFYRGSNDPRFEVVVVGSRLHCALESLDPRAVQAERRRWGFQPSDVVVGFMGRLVAEKGAEDLLEAVATLHRRDSRVKLLIVGTGKGQRNDVEERLRGLVARNEWEFVTFAGFQSDEALYYRMFDVFVLPSRAPEGYAMSAVQAMLAGTPVVAAAVGGMTELVRDRETGVLVPPSSPARLTEAMASLLEDDGLRARIVGAAYAQAMQNNRVEVTTRRAEGLYEATILRAAIARG